MPVGWRLPAAAPGASSALGTAAAGAAMEAPWHSLGGLAASSCGPAQAGQPAGPGPAAYDERIRNLRKAI
eukprot:7467431-Lingulodinium_polyedra.AAC.1